MAGTDPLGNPIPDDGTPAPQQTQEVVPKPEPKSAPSSIDSNPNTDPLGNSISEEEKPPLSSVYRQVKDTDAEKNSKVRKISQATGDPPGFVANNLTTAEKSMNSPEPTIDQMWGTHPKTADWIQDPNHMALVHDDIPATMKHESVFSDLNKSVLQTTSGINKWFDLPFHSLGVIFGSNKWDYFHENSDFVDKEVSSIATPEMDKEWSKALQEKDYGSLARKIVGQIPNVALMSAGSGLGPVVMGGIMGVQTQNESYEEARKAGMSPDKALNVAQTKGVISGVSNGLLFGFFNKLFAPMEGAIGRAGARQVLKQSIKDWGLGTGAMVGQNELELIANAMVDKISGENPHAFDDLAHQMKETAIGGIVSGGLLLSPKLVEAFKTSSEMAKPVDTSQKAVQNASEVKDKFLKVVDAAKNMKLTERSPEDYKTLVKSLKGIVMGDPQIPVDDFKNFYSKLGQEPEEAAKSFGIQAHRSFMDADLTGGNIKIPIEDMLANKAASGELETLADHIKFDSEAYTPNEASKLKEQKPAEEEKKPESITDKVVGTAKDIFEKAKSLFGKATTKEDDLEGIQAAVIDDTGKVWTGHSHAQARASADIERENNYTPERQGFVDKDGNFFTRDVAEKKYGFRTSEELHEMVKNKETNPEDLRDITKNEVNDAQKSLGYAQAPQEGITPQEAQSWKDASIEAKQQAVGEILKNKMQDLGESGRKAYEQEEQRAKAEITQQVNDLPIYRAEDYLKEKVGDPKAAADRILSGNPKPEDEMWFAAAGLHMDVDDPMSVAKLIKDADRDKEIQDRLNAHMGQFTPKVEADEKAVWEAIHRGKAAGAASDLMAKELEITASKIREEDALEKFRQQFSEQLKKELPTDIGKEFGKELEKRFKELPELKQIAAEARKAGRDQSQKDHAFAKSETSRIMNESSWADARNARHYMIQERDNAVKAAIAGKSGKLADQYDYKRKQLLNHELAVQAIQNREVITKNIKAIRKLAKLESDTSNIPYGHWKIIKSLLEDSGFKKVTSEQNEIQAYRAKGLQDKNTPDNEITNQTGLIKVGGQWKKETFQDFKARMDQENPELAARITDPSEPKAFGQMTLLDLKNLRNTVSSIYDSGRKDIEVNYSGKKEKLDTVAQETAQQIKDSVRLDYQKNPQTMTDTQKKIDHLSQIIKNGPINLPQNLSEVTGLGKTIPALTKMYDVKINDGQTEWLKNQREIKSNFDIMKDKTYTDAEKKVMSDRNIPIKLSTGDKPELFSKWQILNLTRLRGSETGYNRLTKGNGYTDSDLDAITSHIDEKDFKFLKRWYRFDEKIWAKMVDTEQRVHNYEPVGIQKRPIVTEHGVLDGGYHPLKYDYSHPKGPVLKAPTEVEERSRPLNPYLNKGSLKERVENYPYPVRLDEDVYVNHLREVGKYLSYEEPLHEINRFLNHPLVDSAMKGGFGGEAGGGQWLYKHHLDFVIHGDPHVSWVFDKVDWALREGRVRNILFHIASRPFLYPVKLASDYRTLAKEHGHVNTLGYLLKSNPFNFDDFNKLKNEVTSKSEVMRERALEAINYDMYSMNNIFKHPEEHERLLEAAKMLYFWPERLADRISYPLWKDVHDQHIAKGVDENTARAMADDHVAKTLGSANALYRSYPQHGSELIQMFSPAWTYFGATLNRAITTGRIKWILTDKEMKEQPVKNAMMKGMVVAKQMFTYVALTGIIEELGRNYAYRRDEEKKHGKEELKEIGKSALLSPLRFIPGAEKIGSAIERPKLAEKIITGVPATEFLYDQYAAAKAVFGSVADHKPMSDRELHDALGSPMEAIGIPERLDSILVNLHHDMQTNQFSLYDLIGPIRKKGAKR